MKIKFTRQTGWGPRTKAYDVWEKDKKSFRYLGQVRRSVIKTRWVNTATISVGYYKTRKLAAEALMK